MIISTIIDIEEVDAHPVGAPTAGTIWFYSFNQTIYQKNSSGVLTNLGEIGVGGGSTTVRSEFIRYSNKKY